MARPAIRFDGFEGEWQSDTLGDMGSTYGSLSGKCKEDFGHGAAKYVTYMNVYSNPVADPNGVDAIEIDNRQHEVKKGDVFFTTSSETPEEVGFTSVWNANVQHTYLNSFCFGYRPQKQFDLCFLAYALRAKPFREQMKKLAQGISRYNISKHKVMDLKIAFPGFTDGEQKPIGSLFADLDFEIKLIQSEHDKLLTIKEAMLQKMFPKHGEQVPEVRFDGYRGKWITRKLADVTTPVTRKNLDNKSRRPLTISAQFGLIDQLEYYKNKIASADMSNYYLLLNGEFAYNKSSSQDAPYGAIKRLDKYDVGALSPLYIPFAITDQLDSDFAVSYFMTTVWHEELRLRMAVGARAHGSLNISPSDFFDISVTVPATIEEQHAIGAFFRDLDRLIELRRQEIVKLKNIKSALLDKMFV